MDEMQHENECEGYNPNVLLCNYQPWDLLSDYELGLLQCYKEIIRDLEDYPSEMEKQQILQTRVSSDSSQHNKTIAGLVYGILLKSNDFGNYFHYITNIVRDNYMHLCEVLNFLISEVYEDFFEETWRRILLLCEKLTEYKISKLPEVYTLILKTIPCCRHSPQVYMVNELINSFLRNIKWVVSASNLPKFVFFKSFRMVVEYSTISEFNEIRNSLVSLIQSLWQNCRSECLKSGREIFRLIPLVSNVHGIPIILRELKQIKNETDSLYIHEVLSPNSSLPDFDPFVSCIIPLNLEKKLNYIINNVKSKNAPRYLQWIISKYK